MTKDIWINLPVKDIAKSSAFFTALGFKFNEQYGRSDHSAALVIGDKNVVVMLFAADTFKTFTTNNLTDTSQSTEVLLSISAESPAEVDELAKKAAQAGGSIYCEPTEMQGWMYGCGFADLDGHRWNVLYMDMSKMEQK